MLENEDETEFHEYTYEGLSEKEINSFMCSWVPRKPDYFGAERIPDSSKLRVSVDKAYEIITQGLKADNETASKIIEDHLVDGYFEVDSNVNLGKKYGPITDTLVEYTNKIYQNKEKDSVVSTGEAGAFIYPAYVTDEESTTMYFYNYEIQFSRNTESPLGGLSFEKITLRPIPGVYKSEFIKVKDDGSDSSLANSNKPVLPSEKSELNIRGSWVSTDMRYNYFIDGGTMYVRDAYKEDQTYTLTKIDIGENDIEIKGHKVGSDEIFSFKVENSDLIIDGIILERVPDIYMLQLLGEWESEIDGYVFQKDGSYQSTVDRSNWGSFFVLNDHEIAMGRMDAFFEIKEYSIENGELMIKGVSPKLRHKDGYKNSYSQLKDLYDIICGGIWVNEFENRAYRFFDDGIYKKYELSYFGDADQRECGTFIIYDNKKIYGYSGFEPFEAPEVCDYNEETGVLRFGENLHRID